MATDRDRSRCRDRLEQVSLSSVDSESMRREALAELRRVVGFDRWCWPLADPHTLLPPDGIAYHDYGRQVPRALELEYSGDDFAAKHLLAGRANPAASLNAETGGDLPRSQRWDEVLRAAGIGDVATVACRDALGCWGWIEMYRDADDPPFAEQDLELLADVGPSLGTGLRRRAMADGDGRQAERRPPGVIVLDRELRPVAWTAEARAWIDVLPAARLYDVFGILPAVVYPAAAVVRSGAAGAGTHALSRTVDGQWVMVDAALLEGRDEGGVAVTFRSATASETFDLLCRVYALSPRESELVALVLAGLDTRAITRRLFISRYTVQDHLKAVFAKIGVHSRRELVTKLGSGEDLDDFRGTRKGSERRVQPIRNPAAQGD